MAYFDLRYTVIYFMKGEGIVIFLYSFSNRQLQHAEDDTLIKEGYDMPYARLTSY